MPKSDLQIQSKQGYTVFPDELIYMVVWVKSGDAISYKRAYLYSHVYYEWGYSSLQGAGSFIWLCELRVGMQYLTRGLIYTVMLIMSGGTAAYKGLAHLYGYVSSEWGNGILQER